MSGEPLLDALAVRVHVLPVRLEVEEVEKLREMVAEKMRR
jgi:hypothetical protein